MNTTPLLLSTTIEGAIVAVLGMLVKHFGLPIGEGELATVIAAALEIIGVVMVIIGRYRAKTTISGILK